jgi:hypothetical protein
MNSIIKKTWWRNRNPQSFLICFYSRGSKSFRTCRSLLLRTEIYKNLSTATPWISRSLNLPKLLKSVWWDLYGQRQTEHVLLHFQKYSEAFTIRYFKVCADSYCGRLDHEYQCFIIPWRWRQYVFPKSWHPPVWLHDVLTQNTTPSRFNSIIFTTPQHLSHQFYTYLYLYLFPSKSTTVS